MSYILHCCFVFNNDCPVYIVCPTASAIWLVLGSVGLAVTCLILLYHETLIAFWWRVAPETLLPRVSQVQGAWCKYTGISELLTCVILVRQSLHDSGVRGGLT